MPTTDVLKDKRIAILATDGFEQSELEVPRRALDDAGARTVLVSPNGGQITGWTEKNWGTAIAVDLLLEAARVDDFDALLIPGGVMNPDQLRTDPRAVDLVRRFFESGKPMAAIAAFTRSPMMKGVRPNSIALAKPPTKVESHARPGT